MTQQQKLNELAEWLEAHGIDYVEMQEWYANNSWLSKGVRLTIPKKRIAVVVCKAEDENSVYEFLKQYFVKAFFIRNSEDMDFITEKMQNCLNGLTVRQTKKR